MIFVELDKVMGTLKGKTFLDFGSGPDLRASLFASEICDMQVIAIEKNKRISEKAENTFQLAKEEGFGSRVTFMAHTDALGIPWNEIDIIYFFYAQPENIHKAEKFRSRLQAKMREARPNTILGILFAEPDICDDLHIFSDLRIREENPLFISSENHGLHVGLYQISSSPLKEDSSQKSFEKILKEYKRKLEEIYSKYYREYPKDLVSSWRPWWETDIGEADKWALEMEDTLWRLLLATVPNKVLKENSSNWFGLIKKYINTKKLNGLLESLEKIQDKSFDKDYFELVRNYIFLEIQSIYRTSELADLTKDMAGVYKKALKKARIKEAKELYEYAIWHLQLAWMLADRFKVDRRNEKEREHFFIGRIHRLNNLEKDKSLSEPRRKRR